MTENIAYVVEQIEREIGRRGLKIIEGSSSIEELEYLSSIARANGSKLVGEIGFNAGFSTIAFLHVCADVEVISFDIGTHPYMDVAKEIIDEKFPGRYRLILGDSKQTVPQFKKDNPETFFDTIFIDGGHDFNTVWSDILSMKECAHKKTDVVIDDLLYCPKKPWGLGPCRAWIKAIKEGIVVQKELYEDGKLVEKIGWCSADRAWARGRYII